MENFIWDNYDVLVKGAFVADLLPMKPNGMTDCMFYKELNKICHVSRRQPKNRTFYQLKDKYKIKYHEDIRGMKIDDKTLDLAAKFGYYHILEDLKSRQKLKHDQRMLIVFYFLFQFANNYNSWSDSTHPHVFNDYPREQWESVFFDEYKRRKTSLESTIGLRILIDNDKLHDEFTKALTLYESIMGTQPMKK